MESAREHQRKPVANNRADVIEAVRRGLEEMKAGLGRPAGEVLAEIRRDFSIPTKA
jgi:hypothetical protein